MELTNDFTVDVSVDEAWEVLTDLERIAPCMPGAELREVEGEDYHGVVKVKVGPITAEYKGKVTFVERDDDARRAVLRAQGREVRGQGHANAMITARLEPADTSTRVSVVTDLTITGRVAQLGRGVLADVSNKLMSEFVDSLEATLRPPGSAANKEPVTAAVDDSLETSQPAEAGDGDGKATSALSGPGRVAEGNGATGGPYSVREAVRPEAEPVNLVKIAGPSLAKRAVPALVLVTFVGAWLLVRRRRAHG
jgi:carbon monoxide dehydrogenase subunit G